MALKNLYDMVKADRYTQDGREAIIKAQEEETEDKVYQIGEISQKTGLQKTANGWVKPKNGKQPGAKKQNAAAGSKPASEGWEETRMASGKIYDLKSQGKRIIEQYDPETETKTFKLRDLNNSRTPDKEFKSLEEAKTAATKSAESKSEGRNFRSELEANPKGAYDFEKTVEKSIPLSAGDKEVLGNVKSFMQEEGTDYKDALKSVATGLVNGNKLHGDWYPEKEKSLLKIAKAVGMDEEVKSYVKTMAKGYDFGYSEDSAPRVLTGDTRIRVRKA